MSENGTPGAPDELRVRLRGEQVRALYASDRRVVITSILVGLLAAIVFHLQQPTGPAAAWGALLVVALAARGLLNGWRGARLQAGHDPVRALPAYLILLGVTAAVWSLGPWLFFPAANVGYQGLMIVIWIGIASARITALR